MSNFEYDYTKWEPKYNFGLQISIATRGIIDARFMVHMHNVTHNLPTGFAWRYEFAISDRKTQSEGTHFAFDTDKLRQRLAEDALKTKCKYTLFIDDDVFIPVNGIKRMIRIMEDGKCDVLCGIYWTKSLPPEPVIYKDNCSGPYFNFPKNKIFKIYSAGLGCCIFKTDILKKIKKPWFKLKWKMKTGKITEYGGSEDLYFFAKLRKSGIQIWADGAMLCDHLDVKRNIFFPGPEIAKKYTGKGTLSSIYVG